MLQAPTDVSSPWYQQPCARALPEFALGTKLGRGAFGVVVEAQHKPTQAFVALKLSDKSESALSAPSVLHRVRSEARVLARLAHPNIMRCFGAVEDETMVALVLTRAVGQSLTAHIGAHGAMEEARAAPICLQLCRALRHCHQKKIAHRDVKLDNVVFDEGSGHAVLCDFGLALAVRTQGSRLDVRCGSHEYSAPELLDPASKGYYGCRTNETLTKRPLSAKRASVQLIRILTSPQPCSPIMRSPAVDMWALGVLTYT